MPVFRFSLLGLLLSGAFVGVGQAQPTRPVRAEVTAVTVFRDRAQLTATARAVAERGSTEIVVSGLPAGLDPTTVQVSAATEQDGAALTLLGVEVRADYTSEVVPRQFATLRDSARAAEARVKTLTDQSEILQKEETALLAAFSQGRVDSDELEDVAELYRNRATAIRAQLQRIESRLATLLPRMTGWQQQLGLYAGPRSAAPGQLVITLAAEQRTAVQLTLSYVTTDAG